MAMYLPPSGAIYDPPAVIREAGEDLLQPRKAPISFFCPVEVPKPSVSFQKAVDSKEEVKKALLTFMVINPNAGTTSYINSIQNVSITISSGTSNTATITAVGANAYIASFSIKSAAASSAGASAHARVTLTNTTTVTATVNTAGTSLTVNCVVVDPTAALVTGVQYGTITISSGATNTATITSVNTALTAIYWLGQTTTSTSDIAPYTYFGLTSATVVTANVSSGTVVTASFCVVTYAAAAVKSLQYFAITSTASPTNQTITAVVVANTMVVYAGQNNTQNSFNGFNDLTLTSTTNLRIDQTGGTFNSVVSCFVLELNSGILNSTQYVTWDMVAATSKTKTITSVVVAKTIVACLSHTGNSTSASNNMLRLTFTNATTLTADCTTAGTSGSNIMSAGVYEFK